MKKKKKENLDFLHLALLNLQSKQKSKKFSLERGGEYINQINHNKFHSILAQNTNYKWVITFTKEALRHPLNGLKFTGLSAKWPEIEVQHTIHSLKGIS